jgi:biotin carboxyl carrier protein
MRYEVSVDGEIFQIVIEHNGRVWVNGQAHEVDFRCAGNQMWCSLLIDRRSHEVHVERVEGGVSSVMVGGRSYLASLQPWGQGSQRAPVGSSQPDAGEIRAPLPGVLVGAPVAVGQRVAVGQVVAILESMKMSLELRTQVEGVVQALYGDLGDEVNQGDVLVSIRPDD